MKTPPPRIFAFAAKGGDTNEERRLRRLPGGHATTVLPFGKTAKFRSFRRVLERVRSERPDLLVMEGTGLAGGTACPLARLTCGQRYVAYLAALAGLMASITPTTGVAARRRRTKSTVAQFDPDRQTRAATAFIADLLDRPVPLATGAS